jgi:hypothetical protein
MSILTLCAVCQGPAAHSGLCCAHKYDEQPPCADCVERGDSDE